MSAPVTRVGIVAKHGLLAASEHLVRLGMWLRDRNIEAIYETATAALANIAVLQEELLIENAAERGAELLARCRSMQERRPLIGDVRGQGLMIGVELVRDRHTKEPAPADAKAVRANMRERGILVGVGGIFGNVVRLQPPLSITADECDRTATALEAALTRS